MVDEVLTSFERCCRDPVFLERFYARFLLESDEARAKFDGVDMKRQASVLRASLYHTLRAAAGYADATDKLRQLAESHSKRGHDIPPHLYDHWLRTLLTAVRESDPQADETLLQAWRTLLEKAIAVMISAYE